eukprot:s6633_g4.t1
MLWSSMLLTLFMYGFGFATAVPQHASLLFSLPGQRRLTPYYEAGKDVACCSLARSFCCDQHESYCCIPEAEPEPDRSSMAPLSSGTTVNHVQKIYESFTPEEISLRIAQDVTPDDCKAKVHILYQTVEEDLHRALPHHSGDWYFTGDYPTPGGARVCCRAFALWMEGSSQRCYGINSALSFLRARRPVLVLGSGAREHALAWKLSKSPEVSVVFVGPGNGGIGNSYGQAEPFDSSPMESRDAYKRHLYSVVASQGQSAQAALAAPSAGSFSVTLALLSGQEVKIVTSPEATVEEDFGKITSLLIGGQVLEDFWTLREAVQEPQGLHPESTGTCLRDEDGEILTAVENVRLGLGLLCAVAQRRDGGHMGGIEGRRQQLLRDRTAVSSDDVVGSQGAFAALRSDGDVVVWGHKDFGLHVAGAKDRPCRYALNASMIFVSA